MELTVRNGHLIDPANGVDTVTDLHIARGRVAALGRPPAGFRAGHEIDATGQVVCPGLVDLATRLREPGAEHTATIASESRAAARGGITTLVVPPDTDPVIDEPAVVELIRRRAKAAGRAWVLTLGALTRGLAGEQLAQMAALRAAGCVGVSNGTRAIVDTLVLRRSMEYAATHDLTVFLTPADPWLSQGGCAHDGPVAARLGLPAIPVAAETAALARDLALVQDLGIRAHFCRLSSASAVTLLRRARADGLAVTADVAMHQLHLTEADVEGFDGHCHVLPPLRSRRDRDALRAGLAEGILAAVCSDHQPHDADAKKRPFADTAPGISGLETLLALGLELVADGTLTLPTLIERLTAGPARVLGIDAGHLGVDAAADVCIFDPGVRWRPEAATLASRGKNTPFLGRALQGRVTHTLVGGRVVHSHGVGQ